MSVEAHKREAPPELRVAVVTVSDTRTEATDEGGRLIRELCREAGVEVTTGAILPDEPAAVAAHVQQLCAAGGLSAVLLTGGTGITRRDTTVEALGARFEKTLDGFGELFRMLSFAEVGAAAMLSRATAGVIAGVAVFLMPGSPKAVRLAMSRLVLPELGTSPHSWPTAVMADPQHTSPADGRTVRRSDDGKPVGGPAGDLGGTLLDKQLRRVSYLRVSVTDRCNYRCTYCMPEDGVTHVDRADILSFEEIVALVRCFVRLGVERVRLTGGEPTVRRDLVDLVRLLRAIPGLREIALSTNGHLLDDLAVPLRAAGVDRLNVSLDTLDRARFASITRRGDLDRVRAGIEAARAAGFASIKINTVAVKGFNDGEIGALCDYAWSRGLIPRFIEQMPMSGGALNVPGTLLAAAEIRRLIEEAFPGHALTVRPGSGAEGGGPARYFGLAVQGGAGGGAPARLVGLITPMTEHFCDTCNRVRLSAGGALHACLAYDDAVDLRTVLQRGGPDAVVATIREALAQKRDGHDFQLVGLGGPRKAMVQIGG